MTTTGQGSLMNRVLWLNREYRNARFNVVLYGKLLHDVKKWNLYMEIAIALLSPGVIIGIVLSSPTAYTLTASAATILAVLKATLPIKDKIEKYTRLHTTYSEATKELEFIVGQVRVLEGFSEELDVRFNIQLKKMARLAELDDPTFNIELKKQAQCQVLKEIPKGHLWTPKSEVA